MMLFEKLAMLLKKRVSGCLIGDLCFVAFPMLCLLLWPLALPSSQEGPSQQPPPHGLQQQQPPPQQLQPPTEQQSLSVFPAPARPQVLKPAGCIECTDMPMGWMKKRGVTCATFSGLSDKCVHANWWNQRKFCQRSCSHAGVAYSGDVCCP